jgi:hypothetical protein
MTGAGVFPTSARSSESGGHGGIDADHNLIGLVRQQLRGHIEAVGDEHIRGLPDLFAV